MCTKNFINDDYANKRVYFVYERTSKRLKGFIGIRAT